jgi:hypothetical protein
MAPVGLQCVRVVVSSGYNGQGLSLTTYPIQFPVEVQFHYLVINSETVPSPLQMPI